VSPLGIESKLKEAPYLEAPNLCKLWVGAELEEGFLVYKREEKPSPFYMR